MKAPSIVNPPQAKNSPQRVLGVSDSLNKAVVQITPQQAAELLENHNGDNRPLSQRVAKNYAKTMTDGRWGDSADQIVFDRNGQLANGQHRLSGVVLSGLPQTFDVKFNVSQDIRGRCDRGSKRTYKDVLALAGFDVTKMHTSILNQMLVAKYDGQPYYDFVVDWYSRYQEEVEFAHSLKCDKDLRNAIFLASFACAAFHYTDPSDRLRLIHLNSILSGAVKGSALRSKIDNTAAEWREAILCNEGEWKSLGNTQSNREMLLSRYQHMIKQYMLRRNLPKFTKNYSRDKLSEVFPKVQVLPIDLRGIDD